MKQAVINQYQLASNKQSIRNSKLSLPQSIVVSRNKKKVLLSS